MNAKVDNRFDAIAGAGVGWKSHYEAKTFWYGRPCSDCSHFEMRMIKARDTDSFGHLWPICNNPALPGEHGQPTQPSATCNHWEARKSA